MVYPNALFMTIQDERNTKPDKASSMNIFVDFLLQHFIEINKLIIFLSRKESVHKDPKLQQTLWIIIPIIFVNKMFNNLKLQNMQCNLFIQKCIFD